VTGELDIATASAPDSAAAAGADAGATCSLSTVMNKFSHSFYKQPAAVCKFGAPSTAASSAAGAAGAAAGTDGTNMNSSSGTAASTSTPAAAPAFPVNWLFKKPAPVAAAEPLLDVERSLVDTTSSTSPAATATATATADNATLTESSTGFKVPEFMLNTSTGTWVPKSSTLSGAAGSANTAMRTAFGTTNIVTNSFSHSASAQPEASSLFGPPGTAIDAVAAITGTAAVGSVSLVSGRSLSFVPSESSEADDTYDQYAANHRL
jgi:hypothetical protein